MLFALPPLLTQGVDSRASRFILSAAPTFEEIAREWHEHNHANWTVEHAGTVLRRIEANLLPFLGSRKVQEIYSIAVLTALRRVESRGAVETAHRVKQICSQIFLFAIATGRASQNPTVT
jgi:integrase